MARTNGPERLIGIYSEESEPGHFRYMFMCPIRLATLIDPVNIVGEVTKHRAARLIARACSYHLGREQNAERIAQMVNIINRMKKFTDAPAIAD